MRCEADHEDGSVCRIVMRQGPYGLYCPRPEGHAVVTANIDKPHRCPRCHAIADPDHKCKGGIVTCCGCGTRFTMLIDLPLDTVQEFGVVCPEHGSGVL